MRSKFLPCIVPAVCFMLAAITTEVRALPPDWTAVHETTMRGIHHLYNLDIDRAVEAFDSVNRMAPTDPRGPFFRSVVHFYLYGLNREERELTMFLDKSEHVIQICEDLLDRDSHDATAKFYLGGIYGYRGLAYQSSGSTLRAAQNGRKGYLLLEEAVNEQPELYDAQMGFGLFRYLLAKLPKSMQWILGVLGFSGDLEGGLASLRLAAERGVYTRAEARLYLAQFLFAEGRRDSAMQYLNDLRAEYPENTLFLVLYAFWQHRMDNLDEALRAARTAMEMNERRSRRYGAELAYGTLGSIYFTLNDFAESARYYRLYFKESPNAARTPAMTYYRAGIAAEIAGHRAEAVSLYRMAAESETQFSRWAAYFERRCRELARAPLSEAEILIIKGDNESSRKNHARALELYRDALTQAGSNIDLRMRALYGIQEAQLESGDLGGALTTSETLLALRPVTESWITPHAWFRLGQVHARLGNMDQARAAFASAESFDDYDFQERLERRLTRELEALNKGPTLAPEPE